MSCDNIIEIENYCAKKIDRISSASASGDSIR